MHSKYYQKKRWKLVAPKLGMPHDLLLVSQREMAQILKITPTTLKKWIAMGWVPPGVRQPLSPMEAEDADWYEQPIPLRWTRQQLRDQWDWMHEVKPGKRKPRWWTNEPEVEEVEDGDLISSL